MNEFAGVLIMLLPLAAVLFFANLGERDRRAEGSSAFAVVAYLLLIGLYALMAMAGLALVLLRNQPGLAGAMLSDAGEVSNIALLGLGFLVPSLVGLILLLPAVRRVLARWLPIEPANCVHAVSLSMSMLVIVNMVITLGIGLSTLSDMVTAAQEETGQEMVSVAGVWTQQIMMALLAVVGVGWPVRRRWGATLERLGLVVPTLQQVLAAVGIAFALVVSVIVIQALAAALGFGLDADVDELTEELLGPLFSSPLGVLTLGLSAALGEETLMRGAAQPRLGLIYTSFLFALLHSNYGITLSTGIVFFVGIILGIVRMRANTTSAMVVHATYNILLGMLAYFSIDLLQGSK